MNENQKYICDVKMEDILWNRLTTAYVRATEFPKYFSIIESMESKNSTRRGIEKYRASKYIMESNAFCYDIFRTHISKSSFTNG